jgi:cytochrome c-type biogenesis protein CcmH
MRRLLILLAFAFATTCAFAIDSESLDDPALQARYEHLARLLRCPKCQNETIAESPAGVAVDLRREVRRMLVEGRSDQEILDFMSERFGDFVLYKPPFTARTVLLWLAPALLLIGALITVVIVIRRRAAQSFDDSTENTTDANNIKADAS